jgi:RNA polymerase sigma factor (TIGR02999 family)
MLPDIEILPSALLTYTTQRRAPSYHGASTCLEAKDGQPQMSGEGKSTSPQVITHLLVAWSDGDPEAAQQLSEIVYDEVRSIAEAQLRRVPNAPTLQATELANELFLRLLESRVSWRGRRHFYGTVTVAMRRLLVDAGRARQSEKRGGSLLHVTLSAAQEVPVEQTDAESLEIVLDTLRAVDSRKAEIVELNYLLGLTREEIAEALEISVPTVDRELRFARAWLKDQLTN